MVGNARSVVIHAYGLVVTDEALLQHRTSVDVSPRISDDKLRAKILEGLSFNLLISYVLNAFEERITGLIGTADEKDSYFIYGGGTVSYVFHVVHQRRIC